MTTPLQRLVERMHHDQAFRLALMILDRALYGDDPMPPIREDSIFAGLVNPVSNFDY